MESSFLNGLNQHGYAFQHRVIHEALLPSPARRAANPWSLLAVEMPVAGAERATRIDFVLHRPMTTRGVCLLVAECKRVNPAYGTWCFSKAPHQRPEWLARQVATESMRWERTSGQLLTTGAGWHSTDRAYDVSFVLKSERPGDAHPVSNDRDAIEMACTQVIRGLNGLIDALGTDADYRRFAERQDVVVFIPAVFTTANLVVGEADLRATDLDSGDLKAVQNVHPRDWLYLQYFQSPQVKHTLTRTTLEGDDFDDLIARSYVRSVAIVSPKGIRGFLNAAADDGWPR